MGLLINDNFTKIDSLVPPTSYGDDIQAASWNGTIRKFKGQTLSRGTGT